MDVQIFDTHVVTHNGRHLHFDVLVTKDAADKAGTYAAEWLDQLGISDAEIEQSLCRFCHTEAANPSMVAQISKRGYAIIEISDQQA